jgi:glycerol transport system ATP-binding protein
MLELKNVSRSAGREPVLAHVSLTLQRDVPTAIVGLSPQGREALLRLLAGVDKPQGGSMRLGGKDIALVRRDRGCIIRVDGAGVKPSGQKVAKLAGQTDVEKVRLGGRLGATVAELDLDQRMRLAIAKARADRPALILLDAPGAGLDLELRERFVADLKTMLEGTGAVVVLAAATADEARGLDGQIVVLDRGVVIQTGAAAEVLAHPVNLTAALATSYPRLNTLGMTAHDGRGVLADGSTFQPPDGLPWPVEGPCTFAFRPDDTTLERAGAGCLRFVVRAAGEEVIGGRRFVRITFANANWLTPQPAAAHPPGAILNAFVERRRLMVFDENGKAIA